MTRTRILFGIGALLAVAALAVGADWWSAAPEGVARRYIGRSKCIDCHQSQAKLFEGSNHDRAMDHATERTVLGDFNDKTLENQGVISRMFRRDGKFFINTEGPDGALTDYEILYTFGVQPLQQYLVELDRGRIQALPIAWDTEKKEWFHLYPDEKLNPGEWLHWTGAGQNWNYMCADCHSTNVQKNYDLKTKTYHTEFSEIDVSCEACHGPGSLHVELATANSLFWDRRHGYAIHSAKKQTQQEEIQICAECHARRRTVHPDYDPGEPFLDHFAPEMLDSNVYRVDGQIDDESFEYTSFRQSLMHQKDVRCTDCHDAHSAKLRLEGNNLCNRCHIPGKFDAPSHHHHEVGSAGAQCVNCHMPQKTYMRVDPRRDHSIRVPRPELTVSLGLPNACDNCHKEKGAAWQAVQIAGWRGAAKPYDEHYAFAIKAGREGTPGGDEKLAAVARKKNLDGIVRASALMLLGRYGSDAATGAIQRGLNDDDPLVRYAATAAMEGHPPETRASRLMPRLSDDSTLVRTEAARLLADVSTGAMRDADRKAFDAALVEFIAGQKQNDDQPAAHLNLGVLYTRLNSPKKAEEEYRTAIDLDGSFTPAYMNLAALLDGAGRTEEAEKLLRRVVELEPKSAEGRYSLGLALAAMPGKTGEAIEQLLEAVRLEPKNARMRFNLGMALQKSGDHVRAAAALESARALQPNEPTFLHALVTLYTERKDFKKALSTAEDLARRHPEYQGILEQTQRAAGTP